MPRYRPDSGPWRGRLGPANSRKLSLISTAIEHPAAADEHGTISQPADNYSRGRVLDEGSGTSSRCVGHLFPLHRSKVSFPSTLFTEILLARFILVNRNNSDHWRARPELATTCRVHRVRTRAYEQRQEAGESFPIFDLPLKLRSRKQVILDRA